MNDNRLLVQAMACQCLAVLRASNENDRALPRTLHPKHLMWMCDEINTHAMYWPLAKMHRWIGFVQAGLLANKMLTLEQVKQMFDESKAAHGAPTEDYDLIDHLDVSNAFQMELGGQG